jgi:hypothetical protein
MEDLELPADLGLDTAATAAAAAGAPFVAPTPGTGALRQVLLLPVADTHHCDHFMSPT